MSLPLTIGSIRLGALSLLSWLEPSAVLKGAENVDEGDDVVVDFDPLECSFM